jgi:hypothetical protein
VADLDLAGLPPERDEGTVRGAPVGRVEVADGHAAVDDDCLLLLAGGHDVGLVHPHPGHGVAVVHQVREQALVARHGPRHPAAVDPSDVAQLDLPAAAGGGGRAAHHDVAAQHLDGEVDDVLGRGGAPLGLAAVGRARTPPPWTPRPSPGPCRAAPRTPPPRRAPRTESWTRCPAADARGGILSLMSGIGMRFPATSSRSLKNLPGSAAHFITCSSVDAANDSADVLSWW